MHVKNPIIQNLLNLYKELYLLSKVNATLDWDMNVNLPPKGADGRASQMAYISELIASKWQDESLRKLLEQAKESQGLTAEEKAIIRNIEYEGNYYFKVPKEIIVEKTKTTTEGFMAWQKAKVENNFADFLPFLKRIINLDQIIAQHLGYQDNPYDALLNMYEQGLTTQFCSQTFETIQKPLTKTLKRIQSSPKYKENHSLINGDVSYPRDLQKQLTIFILKKMGYDFEAGRIDVSTHPFETTLDRYDVRITTWYKYFDFRESLAAGMHEGGHALYEQGINLEYRETPLEGGVSYAIHESQSRFWENIVGRNGSFIHFLLPLLQAFYPDQLGTVSEAEMTEVFNLVRPGLIRVLADEVTYNLHIILRFQLENALINNKLKPEDLPEAWNSTMKEFLTIAPETDAQGVLQDVHWSLGYFGYFPTYGLGNLYSAQIASAMQKEISIDESAQNGELGNILYWLRENIHQYGKLYWPKELIQKVSGEDLNPQYFLDYIENKYSKIYNL